MSGTYLKMKMSELNRVAAELPKINENPRIIVARGTRAEGLLVKG